MSTTITPEQALADSEAIASLSKDAIAKANAQTSEMEQIWQKQRQLLADFQEHRQAMELSIASVRSGNKEQAEGLNKYALQLDEYSVHLRQARTLLSTELNQYKAHLQEMRRLCLDPENAKAMAALHEFIAAVTKLSELQASGALASVSALFPKATS